ncbi:MAG: alpha/beta hydrolase-fold protein [Microscillaceae bacterium]|nr:alpha/beta hydrolase-fold protein [Microscillaceae bacterium]MDW8459682.1 alpha/beta hydrolase-fold protein [Cytophagales bacterium]
MRLFQLVNKFFVSLGWFVQYSLLGYAQKVTFIVQTSQLLSTQEKIFIAGNFNQWSPNNEAYQLTRQANGTYRIVLSLKGNQVIEYKFTRGNWASVETDKAGRDIPNRTLTLRSQPETTLFITIENWKDMTAQTPTPSTAANNVYVLDTDFRMPQLKRNRRIWIMLPLDYHLTDKRYPVIYMHDGQNLFDNRTAFAGEWQVDENLNALQAQGGWGAIVVGIDNGGSERINEYSVYMNSLGGGDGDEYAEFIVKTLKPHIDKYYRTLADRANTVTWGSSMGGLIAFYLGLHYQEVFQNVGVFSPSFWFSQRYFTFAQKFKKKYPLKIYFLGGEQEGSNMTKNITHMVEILKKVGVQDHEIKTVFRSDGQHSEWFWAREFSEAYRWLLAHIEEQKHLYPLTDMEKVRQNQHQFKAFLSNNTGYLHLLLPPQSFQENIQIEITGNGQNFSRSYTMPQVANVSHLPTGKYQLYVKTDKGQYFSQEIIIQKSPKTENK